jgi:hypothetical protein
MKNENRTWQKRGNTAETPPKFAERSHLRFGTGSEPLCKARRVATIL